MLERGAKEGRPASPARIQKDDPPNTPSTRYIILAFSLNSLEHTTNLIDCILQRSPRHLKIHMGGNLWLQF